MLTWSWLRYDELSRDDLYDVLALRGAVFVVEQRCPYLDADGVDEHSLHLLGRGDGGTLQAYLRAVLPGVRYAEPSLGRIVTAPAWRGRGAGRALVAEGLARCAAAWPGQGVRISAQAYLQRFYAGFGFVPVGEPYLDDNIAHIEMCRR